MIISTNVKERIKTMGLFIVQSYKIMMGTMTSLFVPQKCFVEDKVALCTLNDNLYNNDTIHRQTLIFNAFTAFCFVFLYCVEMKREYWIIDKLDINHALADNHLSLQLNSEDITPRLLHIKNKLYKYNNIYFYTAVVTGGVFIVNNIASINILSDKNYGSTTLTTYAGFTMLILIKLYNSFYVSYMSRKKHQALSAFIIEFSSFNSVENKEKIKTEELEMEEIVIMIP